MVENPNCSYIVLISTNNYSGNFERELTAYVTGCYGECEVGKREANDFLNNVEDDSLFTEIAYCIHDDTASRPCSIWPNADGIYNSVAIFFNDKPLPVEMAIIRDRLSTYNSFRAGQDKDPISINGIELVKVNKPSYTSIGSWDLDR